MTVHGKRRAAKTLLDCTHEPGRVRLVAVACSVAARDFGALVPVGKIGSDTRQYDCLVTPQGCSRWGDLPFLFSCVGRVGGDPNLFRCLTPCVCGEGVVLSAAEVFSPFSDKVFMGSLDLQNRTRIGTMNLIVWRLSVCRAA